MRIFREASHGDAIRGETQVWTIENATQAEAEVVWSGVRELCVVDFLHWNEGAGRPGVTFIVDTADVKKMRLVARESRREFSKRIDPKSDL
jgi:hypothetical protein